MNIDSITVIHGDSREELKKLADGCIDSVVTDPPYALTSIVKRFGKAKESDDTKTSKRTRDRSDGYARLIAGGFMNQKWDTGETAFDPEFWVEVLRVLKPGGHVLAFGGTRTYHRLACAIEDAGFEIRDQIGWLFGSGFPKSHNVSKGIDKRNGATRRVVSEGAPVKRMIPGADQNKEGWEKNNGREFVPIRTEAATEAAILWDGWGTALKPAWEPIVLARKPINGTVAENVLENGTGALNIEKCRVGTHSTTRVKEGGRGQFPHEDDAWEPKTVTVGSDLGRWPANVIHDGSEEVIAAFPDAGGQLAPSSSSSSTRKNQNVYGNMARGSAENIIQPRDDSGSAARFFYTAKADSDDRLGSKHPTVKPVDLMRYLARLITPPNGTVLDPFAGTGTTGAACLFENFKAILIEREESYVADIHTRLAYYAGRGKTRAETVNRNKVAPKITGGLFGEV